MGRFFVTSNLQFAKCRLYVSGVYMADFGYIQDF